ncbi:MAG: hypothetical protein L6R40_000693 [Gallowayella cf. fulva]|nr:MAG: hypothetical protein L6R40_000693 [Xanthomendoza cf. fulva]
MSDQNKDKPKKGFLPQDMMDEGRYLAARTIVTFPMTSIPQLLSGAPLLVPFFETPVIGTNTIVHFSQRSYNRLAQIVMVEEQ